MKDEHWWNNIYTTGIMKENNAATKSQLLTHSKG